MLASFNGDGTPRWTKVIGTTGSDYGSGVTTGTGAFYANVNMGADIGATVEGVPIMGAPVPTGILLKLQP